MMSRLLLPLGLVLLSACGQSSPTGAVGQPATAPPIPGMPAPGMPGATPAPAQPAMPGMPAAPGGPALPAVPQNPFAALGQMAQAMQGVQAPMAGAIVNWRQLAEALPAQLAGWNPDGDVQGESGAAMGLAVSEARRSFTQGDRNVTFKIVDSSMNQMAAAMFNMARTVQVDSSQELQRPAELAGNPGFVKYQNGSRTGEATFMVANRFIVEIRTSGAQNVDEVLQLAGNVNVARLGQLAAAAPAAPAPAPAP